MTEQERIDKEKERRRLIAGLANENPQDELYFSVLDKRMRDNKSMLDPLWNLFKTNTPTPPVQMQPSSPEALAINSPYEQNLYSLKKRFPTFDDKYLDAVLTNPTFAGTRQKYVDQGIIGGPINTIVNHTRVVNPITKTGGGVVDSTPFKPNQLYTLPPGVQTVLNNLGIKGKGTEDLPKIAEAAATGGMDYMSLLKILGMVNSGSQTQSNVRPAITPGITPAVAGTKIQDEDLYARYRR